MSPRMQLGKSVIGYKLQWNTASSSGTIQLQLVDTEDNELPVTWFTLSPPGPAEFAAIHQMLRTEAILRFDDETHLLRTQREQAGEDEGGA